MHCVELVVAKVLFVPNCWQVCILHTCGRGDGAGWRLQRPRLAGGCPALALAAGRRTPVLCGDEAVLPAPRLAWRSDRTLCARGAHRCQHRPRHIRTLRVYAWSEMQKVAHMHQPAETACCGKLQEGWALRPPAIGTLRGLYTQPHSCPRDKARSLPVGVVAPRVAGEPGSGLSSGRAPAPPSGIASAGVRLSRRGCSCAAAAVGLVALPAAPSAVIEAASFMHQIYHMRCWS